MIHEANHTNQRKLRKPHGEKKNKNAHIKRIIYAFFFFACKERLENRNTPLYDEFGQLEDLHSAV